jgi:hypothetical protein
VTLFKQLSVTLLASFTAKQLNRPRTWQLSSTLLKGIETEIAYQYRKFTNSTFDDLMHQPRLKPT